MDWRPTGEREALLREVTKWRQDLPASWYAQPLLARIESALATTIPAAPDGQWVLVPREPTQDMLDHAEVSQIGKRWDPAEIYAAMLSAVPASPAPQRGGGLSAEDRTRIEWIKATLSADPVTSGSMLTSCIALLDRLATEDTPHD